MPLNSKKCNRKLEQHVIAIVDDMYMVVDNNIEWVLVF